MASCCTGRRRLCIRQLAFAVWEVSISGIVSCDRGGNLLLKPLGTSLSALHRLPGLSHGSDIPSQRHFKRLGLRELSPCAHNLRINVGERIATMRAGRQLRPDANKGLKLGLKRLDVLLAVARRGNPGRRTTDGRGNWGLLSRGGRGRGAGTKLGLLLRHLRRLHRGTGRGRGG